MKLGSAVSPDVSASVNRHLLVPLGSTEQHGPHLPLDTDARIAEAIATAAGERLDVAVAPVMPFGASGEHASFAGTLSIGSEVLHAVIVELVRSAALTFSSMTLVNGHGGNHPAMQRAVDQMRAEGHQVQAWWPKVPGDAHAGRTETSLMLAIAPDSVQLDRAESGNTSPVGELMADMRAGGVAAVSPNGVLGDPAGASAEEGQALLAELVDDLVAAVAAADSQ